MCLEFKIHIFIRNIFSVIYEFLSYFIVGFIVKILRMKALLIYDFEFWMILSNNFLFTSLYFYFLYHLLKNFYIMLFFKHNTMSTNRLSKFLCNLSKDNCNRSSFTPYHPPINSSIYLSISYPNFTQFP